MGDLEVLTSDGKLYYHDGSTSQEVTTAGSLTNVVEGPGSSVAGDIATFADTTGLLIQDPGLNYDSNTLQPPATEPLLVKAGDGTPLNNNGQDLTLRGGNGAGINGVGGSIIIQPGTPILGHGSNTHTQLYNWQGTQGWEVDNGGNFIPINDGVTQLGIVGQAAGVVVTYGLSVGNAQELNVDNAGNLVTSGDLTGNSITNASYEDFTQISTPSNPSVNHNRLYFKSDGLLYYLNSSGTEVQVGSGGSGNPAGVILAYGGSSAPSGFLMCDGAAVSRTTYSGLFAVVGTAFGVGDGSTTFNVPAMARRVAMGAGGSGTGTIGNAVGNSGGEESHTLTAAESGLPSHTHSITDPGHVHKPFHSPDAGAAGFSLNDTANIRAATNQSTTASFNTSSDATGITVNSVSSAPAGSGHNTIQPSLITNFIIKT